MSPKTSPKVYLSQSNNALLNKSLGKLYLMTVLKVIENSLLGQYTSVIFFQIYDIDHFRCNLYAFTFS